VPSTRPGRDEFLDAGLWDPHAEGASDRLDLLTWLAGLGFTLDEMIAGSKGERFPAMAGDQRLVPGTRLTRQEAIALSGADPDTFDLVVRAFGFRPIDGSPAGEVGITADEARALAEFQQLGSMFSTEEALSFVRLVGSSLSRVAEAAVALFLTDIEAGMVAAGVSELRLAQNIYEAVGLLDGLAPRLDPLLRRHVLQAIERSRRATIDEFERLRYRYAIGFVDLVGFTELSASMDDSALIAFLRDFEAKSFDTVTSAGAQVVKLIGDEVMFVSEDASAACRAAIGLITDFGPTNGERIRPRGGIAYGDVLVRGGDYFGSVVNLASRLVNESVPGEVLVTVELAEVATECSFDPAGRRMVKGFADPVAVRSLCVV
jgi:adenylate cyclase